MIDIETLKARNPIEQVVGSWVKLVREGRNYRGPCPVHGGDGQNLVVYPESGTWHCFSRNCDDDGNDVIAFVQRMHDFDFKQACEYLGANGERKPQLVKPNRPPVPDRVTSKPPPDAGKPNMFMQRLGDPSLVWEYKDLDGGTLGYVARYETQNGKEIRCWSFGARGSESPVWGCGGFSRPRPLYGLELLRRRADAPVCITEGEKACDAAQALLRGYVAVTWPGGVQAWRFADWSPLKGRTVLLWPDADEPGITAMRAIAEVLVNPGGLACKVRIIDPTGQPQGWDAADFEGTTEDLISWAKPRASDYIHKAAEKSTELSTDQTGESGEPPSGAVGSRADEASPDPSTQGTSGVAQSTAPGGSSPPPAPDPSAAQQDPPPDSAVPPSSADSASALDSTEALGDEQPPGYMDVPPLPGTSPEPPKSRRRKPDLSVVNGNTLRKPEIQDDPELPTALTENGSAARFAALHKDEFRCVHEWTSAKGGPAWLTWDGRRWKREPTRLTAWQRAESFVAGLEYQPEAQFLTRVGKDKFNTKKYIVSVLDLAQYRDTLVSPGALFDADQMLLGTPGGTVDLRTGMLRPAEREHYITRLTLVEPMGGDHPLFDQVIRCATNGEIKVADYLWRLMGYWLTGSCQEEQFTFLRGDEGSGKGTLVKAIADILGEYATVSDMEAFTESRGEKAPQHRAKLEGARFTYASETNQNRLWNEAQINYMTGRDKIEGQRLWENKRDFEMTAKILIYGNYIPRLRSGIAVGLKRRLHLIEYHGKIENPDPTFKDRLRVEYPAILFDMIQGCLEWQKYGGLSKPEEIAGNVSRYFTDQDYINGWIEDCLDAMPGATVSARELYQSFKHWCMANNQFCPPSGEFSKRLIGRGWNNKHTKAGSAFTGWQIKAVESDRNPPPYYDRD